MRWCYIAGREEAYTRTRHVAKALRNQGVELLTCFPGDKSFTRYPGLLLDFARKQRQCDLVLVGFYGQVLLPFVRLLTDKRVLFDMYIGTYETLVDDRGQASAGSWQARLYLFSDYLSCRLADLVILESQDHVRHLAWKLGMDESKFVKIFLATDQSVIHPLPGVPRQDSSFLVHFHGEYAPFHGVEYILQAAHLLRHEHVKFQLIGRGLTYQRDRALADELHLTNVTFLDPVPFEELAHHMAKADVCLGFFGDTDRTMRVTSNKVVEALAVAKPVVTTRNRSIEELLIDGESALLIERADPQALADAIAELKRDPLLRQRIARAGHQVFQRHCTLEVLGSQLVAAGKELINRGI